MRRGSGRGGGRRCAARSVAPASAAQVRTRVWRQGEATAQVPLPAVLVARALAAPRAEVGQRTQRATTAQRHHVDRHHTAAQVVGHRHLEQREADREQSHEEDAAEEQQHQDGT